MQAERLPESALVCEATGDVWQPLTALRRSKQQARDDRKSAAAASLGRATAQGERRASRAQLAAGAVLLCVGIGASLFSYASTKEGGTYLVFRGMIFVGIVLMIRSGMKRR